MEFIDKVLKLANPQELGYAGVFEFLIQFHILFGLVSLLTGTAILTLKKGNTTHKQIGRVFVIVMLGNFLLGVPLGSAGQLMVGEPANLMTVIGAIFVGAATFSGYRLAAAGVHATRWYDKGMLGLQIISALCYLYLATLMVIGTSLFGLTALTLSEAQQFSFSDNSFNIFQLNVALISTSSGNIFAIIASENFATPLFLGMIAVWFSYQDWIRVQGHTDIARSEIINQHLTRLLVVFGAAISAVLLNTSWVSYATCWSFPPLLALGLSYYFRQRHVLHKPNLASIRPPLAHSLPEPMDTL
jgi:hypothetical protein